jgi:TRAP-type C4-dicarboxylate transport system permease small subunit
MTRTIVQAIVCAFLVFAVIALIPFAWILRDGLGPDSVTSSGMKAISRCFMTFYSGPILTGLAALAVVCQRTGIKKQEKPAEQTVAADA